MVYEWKTASYIKADANVAGKQCEELEKTVGLTAKNLLDANRDENAPLHNEFEWRDSIAAEKYRENQAQHIIACLCVRAETATGEQSEPVRAFLKTAPESEYQSLNVILQSADSHSAMLAMAFKELKAFQRKYKALAELKLLFDVLENIAQSSEKDVKSK